jgi:hypothetical protein
MKAALLKEMHESGGAKARLLEWRWIVMFAVVNYPYWRYWRWLSGFVVIGLAYIALRP